VGDTVVLECYPSLHSEVRWTMHHGKSKSIIVSNGVFEKEYDGRFELGKSLKGFHHLIIKNCSKSDAGMYVCEENNGAGEEHRVILQVQGKT